MLGAMRSDAESIVIVVWVVLALVIAVAALYDAIGNGGWPVHLLVLVAGELVLAGLAKLALRAVAPRR
jgi:fatty acid desaturase